MLELQNISTPSHATYFVEIILPLAIEGTYTYRVPRDLNYTLGVGKRVIVPFGRSKLYSGIIARIHQQAPERYEAKYILEILDEQPIIKEKQLQLWNWIHQYYFCALGEVMQAALPSALKLASETVIMLKPGDPEAEPIALSDKEYAIVEALELAGSLKVSEVVKILGQKRVFPFINQLLNKGLVQLFEDVKDRYKPKLKTLLGLNPVFHPQADKKALIESLNRAPKQLNALLAYYVLSSKDAWVDRDVLLEHAGCGRPALKALIDKEIFQVRKQEISRFSGDGQQEEIQFELSADQARALKEIQESFLKKDVSLLYGVTASGKTQVYIKCIEEALRQGKSVLYLLPEIALTSQIVARLKVYFGDAIGVYHSRLNEQERAEVWKNVLSGKTRLVLGARSAVFLPFQKLELIIVDEEHEVSFKQFNPAPRYHGRDTAIYLATLYQAKVLLGSATPSLESYYNARSGKYGLVYLKDRYGAAELPEIQIVNLREKVKDKHRHLVFSEALLSEIKTVIARKEQVILFQNRRGHTPFLLCHTCGYTPKCIHCDVSLTFHKSSGQLHCHYCGFKEAMLQHCPACGSTHIQSRGFGTERIEEELEALLPEARTARLDLDTTRSKHSFERILQDFDAHRYDILIGTQMVAKGLDFGKVSLIGIIQADSMINFPDFRAFERSFALLAQVSGRAGRRGKDGKVLIQAYAVQHRILQQVQDHDYMGMFQTEIEERKAYVYPPFVRLIRMDIKHKHADRLPGASSALAKLLRAQFGEAVLGPEVPLVGKIRGYYIHTVLLKIEIQHQSTKKVKQVLREILRSFQADKTHKGTLISVDVDPY